MVTGAVPVELSTTGKVDAVFNETVPKAKLGALMLNAGTLAAPGFTCKVKVLEMPPAAAVRITGCASVTADRVAVKPALVALAGTSTVAGTATAIFPLVTLTVNPLPSAVALSVTVHVSVPAPAGDALAQEIAVKTPGVALALLAGLAALVGLLLPEELLHPDTAKPSAQHTNIVNSLARESPSPGRGMRSYSGRSLNNVRTSVDTSKSQRLGGGFGGAGLLDHLLPEIQVQPHPVANRWHAKLPAQSPNLTRLRYHRNRGDLNDTN
jgi:hypothetical protein